MKECRTCKEAKPKTDFYLRSDKLSRMPDCKKCYTRRTNKNSRLRKFGLTHSQVQSILDAQEGKCAICRTTVTVDSTDTTDAYRVAGQVDHDHATGKVRGILCRPCNLGLGKFKDDPEILESALEYLRSGND